MRVSSLASLLMKRICPDSLGKKMILFKAFEGLRAVNDRSMKGLLSTAPPVRHVTNRRNAKHFAAIPEARMDDDLLPSRQQRRDAHERNAAVFCFRISGRDFEEALTQPHCAQIIGGDNVIGRHHLLHTFGAQF